MPNSGLYKKTMQPVDTLTLLQPNTPSETTDASQRDRDSLRRSCQDFEAIFIQYMFKSMRKSIPDGGLFEKDTAHEIYLDMLDAEVAKEISRQQSPGLADQMYHQMEKLLDSHPKK